MLTVPGKEILTKTATEQLVYNFDWNLAIPLTASIQTSTLTATAIRPATATVPTLDSKTATARGTQLRVSGGVKGAYYQVLNQITTNESPLQVIEEWFFLAII